MRLRTASLSLVLLSIPLFCLSAQAPSSNSRFALVIGNSDYTSMPKLKNPANDAADLTAALKRLGFKVTLLTNTSRKAMNQAIVAFREALAQDRQSEGVFFFAGHGVQARGVNYLIPVGADIQAEVDLEDEAVSAQKILGSLEEARNRVNLVILDACRDNPLPSTLRSSTRGLAVVTSAPPETLILYSTAAGQTAADGEGRNSPFAEALLGHIGDAGDVTQTVKVITGEVKKTTKGQQIPYVYMGLSVDFALNPPKGGAQARAPTSAPARKPTLTVEQAYGSVTVEARTGGTLFLNGDSMGQLAPGSSARLDDVEVGQVSLEMRYEDGKTEVRSVKVSKDELAKVSFAYVEQATLPEYMALVEGGTFNMGDTFGDGWAIEKPFHWVKVSSFYLGMYEVTQREWHEVMGTDPSHFKGDDLPVDSVSWYDAVEYCNRLSEKKGLDPCYSIKGTNVTCDFSKNGFRLPTEAEWEFAAKGGTHSLPVYKYAGGNAIDSVGWYAKNAGGTTHAVGRKAGNQISMFDMTGNVWEWCWDWHGPYSSSADSQTNPTGASLGQYRVVRGGSWNDDYSYERVSNRPKLAPDTRAIYFGFRVATRAP